MSRERQGTPVPAPPGNRVTLGCGKTACEDPGVWLGLADTPRLSLPAEPIVSIGSQEGRIPQRAGLTELVGLSLPPHSIPGMT